MASWGPNRMDLVVAGSDNRLYHKSWASVGWWSPNIEGFHQLGPELCFGEPATVTRGENSLDVFEIGADSQLYRRSYENGKWKERECLGGACQHSPAAVALSANRVDVFITGFDSGLYHKWFDGQWHPSQDGFDKITEDLRGSPTAVSWGPSHIDIFYLGVNSGIHYTRWDGTSFKPTGGPYFNLEGQFLDAPAAVSWGENRVDLVARSRDHKVYHRYWNGTKWNNEWTKIADGEVISQPHVASWGSGRLACFAIDKDRSLVHCWHVNSRWYGWEKIGLESLSIDWLTCTAHNRINVFYRGVDNIQYHTYWNGSSWQPSNRSAEFLGRPHDATLATNIPVTGVTDTNPDAAIGVRHELSDLQSKYKEQFDLFIRAFRNVQLRPESNSLSFYAIGGIHGVPYARWPFEEKPQPGDNVAGYCLHRSVLFPAWHRLYLLLLEQTIQAEAVEVAKEFTGPFHEIYADAAAKLRFPYWDWTKDDGAMPRASTYPELSVAHGGPDGTVSYRRVPNPLAGYTFRDSEMRRRYFVDEPAPFHDNVVQVWSNYTQTMRCPNDDGVSQNDVVDTQMYKQHRNMRDMVYKLMTVNEYQPFSSTGYDPGGNINNTQSLEGIHDGVHVMVGIDPTPLDGHMGSLAYAGFDPMFYLHHTNVDRLYALWCCCHPGVTVEPQAAAESIIFYEAGKVQDENTPLYPYRHRDGRFVTSKDVDGWDGPKRWGYRYPEMPEDALKSGDSEWMRKYVNKQVIKLFGPEDIAYPNVPKEAVEKANEMNALANSAQPGTNRMEGTFQITPGQYPIFDTSVAHRREWLVNLKIENFAVPGSFNIHFFLGDFNPSPLEWSQDFNLAGTHSVFSSNPDNTGCANCVRDAENHAVVSGGISLTTKLVEKGLLDLEPDRIVPYLRENLHWRVQTADGTYIQSSDLPSLAVSVSCTIVELADDPDTLPQWAVPQIFTDITKDKAGGAQQGTTI